jgi:hypothetical protein
MIDKLIIGTVQFGLDYGITNKNGKINDDEIDKIFDKSKRMDKGYNSIYIKVQRKDGRLKNQKIDIYTSSGIGNRIRDAETGQYFPNIVGSKDEDLFFKVALATGECKSKNGSNTLFYSSPQHYANHLHCDVIPEIVSVWEEKRNARLIELKYLKRQNMGSVVVN